MHELLRFSKISDKDEAKHKRYFPIKKKDDKTKNGKYLLATPLKIKIRKKTQDEVSPIKRKRLRNLITVDECTKIIDTVDVYILKMLIEPSFKGHAGGWLPCPSALQAKIRYMLHMLQDKEDKNNPFNELEAVFLRKYFMYINSLNRPKKIKEKVDKAAADLWEHVSPAKVIKDEKYKNIKDWEKAAKKIETANRFFTEMFKKGLMAGAKVFPANGTYEPKSKKYRIFFKSNL